MPGRERERDKLIIDTLISMHQIRAYSIPMNCGNIPSAESASFASIQARPSAPRDEALAEHSLHVALAYGLSGIDDEMTE